MPAFENCELLAKSQVFEKECATNAEEPQNRACQEADGVYHGEVLSHLACGRQLLYLVEIIGGQNFGEAQELHC
jgi:hypothetical protein